MLDSIRHKLLRTYQSYFPAKLTIQEHQLIHHNLSNKSQSLFYSQPLCDQRHAFEVYYKANNVFLDVDGVTDTEIFLTCMLHDIGKRTSNLSVTGRIIVSIFQLLYNKSNVENLKESHISFLRRAGIYMDHARLSFNIIKNISESKFVQYSVLYHHNIPDDIVLEKDIKQLISLFIEADNL